MDESAKREYKIENGILEVAKPLPVEIYLAPPTVKSVKTDDE